MSNAMVEVSWYRVIGAGVAAGGAVFVVVSLIVTAYAFSLAFQARGAPDPNEIQAFATEVGRWRIVMMAGAVFAASLWVVRRAAGRPMLHGVLVGVVAGVTGLLMFDATWLSFLGAAGYAVAGGAGGRLGARWQARD